MAPVVTAFQAMRGLSLVNATTVVAETGNIRRFDQPR
jgi:transposase